jgi:hypothetical protein
MNIGGPSRPTSLHYGEWAAVTSGEVRCLRWTGNPARQDGTCGKLLLRLGAKWKGHVRQMPRKGPLTERGIAALCDCGQEHEVLEARVARVKLKNAEAA